MALVIDKISIHTPSKVLTNKMLASQFDITEAEILKRTGIETRYLSAEGETASDLAFQAGKKLLDADPSLKNKIDLLIFCSDCFDYIAPATSCILQDRLGLPKTTACLDLPYGCTGYVYGLGIANAWLHSDMAKTVLFLCCDTSTKTLHPESVEQRSLFSDVATASIITKNEKGPDTFVFGTDGSGAHDLYIEGSAFRAPVNSEYKKDVCLPNGQMYMDGTGIFSFALKTVPPLLNEILQKCNLKMEDVDLFIFHQANGFILETLRKKLNIPKEKFYSNIKDYGNTVVSTIPLAIYGAEQEKVLKRGMKLVMVGFGVGNSWAATVINY